MVALFLKFPGSVSLLQFYVNLSSFSWVSYLLNFHSTPNISHKHGTLPLKVALDGQVLKLQGMNHSSPFINCRDLLCYTTTNRLGNTLSDINCYSRLIDVLLLPLLQMLILCSVALGKDLL